MSRTDKDKPAWVIAEWWEPWHVACPLSKRYWGHSEAVRHPCNLPDEPRVVNGRATYTGWSGGRGLRYWEQCRWEYVWPAMWGYRSYRQSRPPKWFVDHLWHNPERVRERDDLRALRDEYNRHGNLEDGDFPCWQARHYARRKW